LRRGVWAVLSVVLLLFAAAAVLVAVEVAAVRSATGKLRDKYDPAALNTQSLLAGYINQETGERGYLITGEQSFLEPYTSGATTIAGATQRLTELFDGEPLLRELLQKVTTAGSVWRQAVTPEVNARKAGDVDTSTRLVLSGASKTAFDDLRARLNDLQSEVANRRANAQNAQGRDAETLVIALIVAAGTATVAVVGLAVASRRWVVRPIERLGAALHHVQAGSLHSPLVLDGPAELRALAGDADAMRQRLVEQIESASRAREGLAQGAPVVLDIRRALQAAGTPDAALDLRAVVATAEGEIAGDWWDIATLGPDRQVVIIADVSGHGAAAGLLATQLKSAVLTSLALHAGAPDVLRAAADHVFAGQPDKFATLAMLDIDLGAGTVSWTSAGHPPPLLIEHTGEVHWLDATGPLVHPIATSWTTRVRSFRPGDLLVIYSDGLTEARDATGAEFGAHGLRAAIRDGSTAEQTASSILDALAEHTQSRRQLDDVTLVVVRRV